ncbi:MAG: AraC family transcriptional regulator [Gammaproteobacteria bacterium]|nr:AraC family transcriptional regulator [Gammaproteobacteria bacterium]
MTKTFNGLIALLLLCIAAPVIAQGNASMDAGTAMAAAMSAEASETESRQEFRSLDQDVQSLKKEVLDLNRDLFLLEEELLFPANSQVAFFISMDVGEYFELDSVNIKIDGKEVANYLYTEREADALIRGGVHRVHMANLKTGDHELVAIFTGKGPHVRDYRRGATMTFDKGIGAKYLELEITDRVKKQQPEFVIKEWE